MGAFWALLGTSTVVAGEGPAISIGSRALSVWGSRRGDSRPTVPRSGFCTEHDSCYVHGEFWAGPEFLRTAR